MFTDIERNEKSYILIPCPSIYTLHIEPYLPFYLLYFILMISYILIFIYCNIKFT